MKIKSKFTVLKKRTYEYMNPSTVIATLAWETIAVISSPALQNDLLKGAICTRVKIPKASFSWKY
jgi:hypothetical protein